MSERTTPLQVTRNEAIARCGEALKKVLGPNAAVIIVFIPRPGAEVELVANLTDESTDEILRRVVDQPMRLTGRVKVTSS